MHLYTRGYAYISIYTHTHTHDKWVVVIGESGGYSSLEESDEAAIVVSSSYSVVVEWSRL